MSAEASDAAVGSIGSIVGDRFRIEETLGSGGMAIVYEATDLHRDERVALKILQKSRRVEEESRARFHREAEMLARMDHPAIVKICAFGISNTDVPWLAMELLQGETLGARVRRAGPISASALVPILTAICDALATAHACGIVHRDLKPENIFLPTRGPAVKLLDFGLSLSTHTKRLTGPGAILGTPRYMAPEQITDPASADHRVDIYAAGVIVYEALTGQSPFAASDQGQLLGAILQHRHRPVQELVPDIPHGLPSVIRRALADSDRRYATATEFAKCYASAATGRARSSRSRYVQLGAILLLLCAIAATFTLWLLDA